MPQFRPSDPEYAGGGKFEKFKMNLGEFVTTYYQSPIGLLRISGSEQFISEINFVDKIEKPPGDKKRQLPPLMIQCL